MRAPSRSARRGRLAGIALALALVAEGAAASDDTVEVWIDLSEPALAAAAANDDAARAELVQRIERQQADVAQKLRELGAREEARVRVVRNAIAVHIAPARLDAARAIPGVIGVSPVRHRPRDKRHVDAT